ncbi:hypothetical protein D3C72_1335840 [compost metagenome]
MLIYYQAFELILKVLLLKIRLEYISSVFYFFVISTEGKNHTRSSTKIDDSDCGVFCVISPFGQNDKLCVYTFNLKIRFNPRFAKGNPFHPRPKFSATSKPSFLLFLYFPTQNKELILLILQSHL